MIPRLLRLLSIVTLTWTTVSAQLIEVRSLRDTGPSAHRLNLVILGDGFTAAEQTAFFREAATAVETIITDEALAPFADFINATAIYTESAESGTIIPAENLAPQTYFGTAFTAGENSRLVQIPDLAGRQKVNDLLFTHAPDFDYAVMLVNSTRDGGGGGVPLTVTLNASSRAVLLHESGHSFAGLADEYVDEEIADDYPPAEFPNSTPFGSRELLPWRRFVSAATPVPTPASAGTDIGTVGAFEGSHYRSTGAYRPVYESKMRDRFQPWGAVNLRAFAQAVHRLNLNEAELAPIVTRQALTAAQGPDTALRLTPAAQGVGPFTYQWIKDGRFLIGQTAPTLDLGVPTPADYGHYVLEITNAVGSTNTRTVIVDADGARLTDPLSPELSEGRLTNMSVRTLSGSPGQPLTLGFTVASTETTADPASTKPLLVRAIGPGLAPFYVSGYINDPILNVAPLGQALAASNDNWGGAAALSQAFTAVGAFALDDPNSTDAALLFDAQPLPHTAQVTNSIPDISGTVLIEIYDTDDRAQPRLVNLSTRSTLGPMDPALVAGFVYSGQEPKRFLIRAIGPGLAQFQVTDLLEDPQLEIHSLTTGEVIASNLNWGGASALVEAFTAVGAFALPDPGSTDAALIIELESGPYTATITSTSTSFGTVLIEVYELP